MTKSLKRTKDAKAVDPDDDSDRYMGMSVRESIGEGFDKTTSHDLGQ